MEPLHPDVRAELKKAYPRLDDGVLDEYERLTNLRMTLDPEQSHGLREEIDAKRKRLIAEHMPTLGAIENMVSARRRQLELNSREGGKSAVTIRRSNEDRR